MFKKNRILILPALLSVGLLLNLVRPVQARSQTGASPAESTAASSKLAGERISAPQPQAGPDGPAKIDPQVLKAFSAGETADYFIWMTEKADLSPAYALTTKEAKGQFVFDALRSTAESSQAAVRAALDAQGVQYQAFYISNKILVKGGSQSLLTSLAARPDVARITANNRYQLEEPQPNPKAVDTLLAVESNISFINADDVWAIGFTGQGVVLAGNDTGLDWQHPAIINHYRGWNGAVADHNYNWWDATDTYPTAPADGFGHGTHTTGTMVGDDGGTNQIGVAPGAKTIHCKNLTDGGWGTDAMAVECFQWNLAPWDLNGQNPRPDLAPDAVNNSWGIPGGGNPEYEDEIAALQAAGILVEASAGNEGPSCQTLGSPGDYSEVLTTGSVSHASGSLPGSLSWFSSRGPSSLNTDFLPDVMAPGENIRSSLPGGVYQSWNGTSMSGPHVTGLIGLMWAANPGLRGFVPETQQIIFAATVPLSGQTGSNCGGDYDVGPNNDWGYGTIDALAAVEAAITFGGTGLLEGTVTDAVTSSPLESALVRASLDPDLAWQTTTNALGEYSRAVFSGTYTVTAELYGYFPTQDTGVTVISGTTTTHDIAMSPAPTHLVTGRVTDATTGWPLYARLDIIGYPFGPIWTDPVTGQYTVSLAGGVDYTFWVTAWVDGYQTFLREVGVLTGDQTEDFAMFIDALICSAPGYEPDFVYFEDFEANDGGFGVSGNTSWAWGAPTSGPRSAHSGDNVWATNLAGNYFDNESGAITSPAIDLSAYAGQTVIVTWWQWLQTEGFFDFARVEASKDGGANWTTVYGPVDGIINSTWTKQTIVLDPTYAVSDFHLRFYLDTDFSVTFPGFYVDDVGVGVASLPPLLYSEDFEADNGSFAPGGTNRSWEWGTPTRGPGSAHSGSNAWATDLDDDYNNNEDSTLTSPTINLSAAAGEFIEVSWWQWLQTESGFDFASVEASNDGGSNWTVIYGPTSGLVDSAWAKQSIVLDPSYAASNFELRFTLESDGTVTYPGFYLDDLEIRIFTGGVPALACDPDLGGLVVGNVYDFNTNAALDGASLNSVSDIAFSQPTPDDPALDDGFYTLFAPAGAQPITATLTAYASVTMSPIVPLDGAVRQDFQLPAGLLAANPGSLQASLDMGSAVTLDFDLENNGGEDSNFELREKGGDFIPLLQNAVSVPGNSLEESTGPTYAGQNSQALVAREAWTYQPPAEVFSVVTADVLLVAAADVTQIQSILLSYPDLLTVDWFDARAATPALTALQAYDSVVVISNNTFADPIGLGNVLADYVDAGGTVVQTVPTFYDDFGFGWGLKGRFIDEGYSPFIGTGDWFSWADLDTFDASHPIMEGVTSAGDFFRQIVDLAPGAEWVASWTDDEFIATTDNVVALNTFLPDGYAWTGDIPLIVHNSIIWLVGGGDVVWLSTQPITGTVEAQSLQTIQVTLDAGVPEIVQPGAYTAQIRILDNTPYDADAVQVTMDVNPPPDWGKLAGTITGLEVCDAPGAPLAGVNVQVEGVATTLSDASGLYGYWMPEGSYLVTVYTVGYLPQTFTAAITAGQTFTQNIDMRPAAPCLSQSPDALVVSVPEGATTIETLTLDNAGAGTLLFSILESDLDLARLIAIPSSDKPAAAFQVAGQSGPASVLTLASQASQEGGDALLSGWFGGLDLPGGLIRYAFAQCQEQAESYYVFGGIDGSFSLSTKAWRYDAATNTWTQLADMPAGGEAPAAACYQGRIYVMGGSGTDQFYIYNIAGDSWSNGAPLPRGVEGAAAGALDGKVFMVGGDDNFWPGDGVSGQVDIYDIASGTWIGTGAPMPVPSGNAGYVQAGSSLYVVGGWGDLAPSANVNATQRYDLGADVWELGPAFSSARADFALAATEQALYAMGGDEDANFFFEATVRVQRLDLGGWPAGDWQDNVDPLPVAFSANNGGFCTQALFDAGTAEVWSLGGLDTSFFTITGRTLFNERSGENCASVYTDVSWLAAAPASGFLDGDSLLTVEVTLGDPSLQPGIYTATLVVVSNDEQNPLLFIPVTLLVGDLYNIYLPLLLN